jgi:hypothetical protein
MNEEECAAMNQRVTDVETDIHGHIRNLSDKFDGHHTMLTTHIEHFEKHEREEIVRHDQFIESQALNTSAINDLTTSVSGVVEVYNTTNAVGRFVKWFAGIAVVIASLIAYFKG